MPQEKKQIILNCEELETRSALLIIEQEGFHTQRVKNIPLFELPEQQIIDIAIGSGPLIAYGCTAILIESKRIDPVRILME